MTGNSLQVFSIMMVFMLFKTPITAILGIQATFSRFETEGTKSRMLLVKIVYVLCNCLSLALGIWKVNQMGLLPYVYRNACTILKMLTFHSQHDTIRLACLGDSKRTSRASFPCIFCMTNTLMMRNTIQRQISLHDFEKHKPPI
jgi:hypothetical protein